MRSLLASLSLFSAACAVSRAAEPTFARVWPEWHDAESFQSLYEDRTGHELAGARLELRPPDGRTRRRSWGVHPACGCDWDGYPGDTVRAG